MTIFIFIFPILVIVLINLINNKQSIRSKASELQQYSLKGNITISKESLQYIHDIRIFLSEVLSDGESKQINEFRIDNLNSYQNSYDNLQAIYSYLFLVNNPDKFYEVEVLAFDKFGGRVGGLIQVDLGTSHCEDYIWKNFHGHCRTTVPNTINFKIEYLSYNNCEEFSKELCAKAIGCMWHNRYMFCVPSKEDNIMQVKEYLNIPNKVFLNGANEGVIKVLNDPYSTDDNYANAIRNWKSPYPIFPFLRKIAKPRFVNYVFKTDDLDKHPYILPDFGPDVDNDGAIETTQKNGKTYNELGEEVDTTRYVCWNFSREIANRYGIGGKVTKPRIFQLPLFIALMSVSLRPETPENEVNKGHVINAIYLEDSWGKEDMYFKDESWLFIEPQNDNVISDPLHYIYPTPVRWVRISTPTEVFLASDTSDIVCSFANISEKMSGLGTTDSVIFEIIYQQILFSKLFSSMKDAPFPNQLNNLSQYDSLQIYSSVEKMKLSRLASEEQVNTALHNLLLPPNFWQNPNIP